MTAAPWLLVIGYWLWLSVNRLAAMTSLSTLTSHLSTLTSYLILLTLTSYLKKNYEILTHFRNHSYGSLHLLVLHLLQR